MDDPHPLGIPNSPRYLHPIRQHQAGHPRPVFVYQIQAERTLDQVVQAPVKGLFVELQNRFTNYAAIYAEINTSRKTSTRIIVGCAVPPENLTETSSVIDVGSCVKTKSKLLFELAGTLIK